MGRKKLDKPHALAVPMTALLLLGCVCLLIGAAWARYRYRQTTDLVFSQKTAPQVYLFGGEENGSFTPMPETLTDTENGQTLAFLVTNGQSAAAYSGEDQYAQVRLYGSLSLGNGENLTAVLTVDGTDYAAVARQLDVDSPMYTSFGEGWFYCFVDENGNEVRWLLEGEKLSSVEMTLTVNAQNGLDTSLLRLMVTSQAN